MAFLHHKVPHGAEKRRPFFKRAGHAFAIPTVLQFILIVFVSSFSIDNWQEYFFKGTLNLKDNCTVAVWQDNNLTLTGAPAKLQFSPIKVPHFPEFSAPENIQGQGNILHAHYLCKADIESVDINSGGIYLQTGYIIAEEAKLLINSIERMSFKGLDKAVVPLTSKDLSEKKLIIEIILITPKQKAFGLNSKQPIVIASGPKNEQIMGLGVILNKVQHLVAVLPLLTLALVIIYGWFSGIRIRSILPAIYFLCAIGLFFTISYFNDVIGLNFITKELICDILILSAFIAFFLFNMEIVKILPKFIYPIMKVTTALTLLLTTLALITNPDLALSINIQSGRRFFFIICGLSLTIAIALKIKQKPYHDTGYKKLDIMCLFLLTTFTVVMAIDSYFIIQGKHSFLSRYVWILLPLFLAGIFFYNTSLVEKLLMLEKGKTEDLQQQWIIEQAKTEILSKFLPESLLRRFSDRKNMQDNLVELLSPREKNVALLQADVREFSLLSEAMQATKLARTLQRYYNDVVEYSQEYGQIKLIGDCIFVFIEEERRTQEKTAADLALEIAAKLICDTHRLNLEHQAEGIQIYFRTAIHFGPAFVGNLSSENCIDYTAIGRNVNLVARLEELTKNPQLKQLIGYNAVLLSQYALQNLKYYKSIPLNELNLKNLNIHVRNFKDIRTIFYLREQEIIELFDWQSLRSAS